MKLDWKNAKCSQKEHDFHKTDLSVYSGFKEFEVLKCRFCEGQFFKDAKGDLYKLEKEN